MRNTCNANCGQLTGRRSLYSGLHNVNVKATFITGRLGSSVAVFNVSSSNSDSVHAS